MKKFNLSDVKRIIKIYVAIIIPILIIAISIYNYLSKSEIDKTKEILIEVQKQKAKTVQYIIQSNFNEAYENLLVVKNSNDLKNYINYSDINTKEDLEQLFLRIVTSKKNFDQIRFLDNNGDEVIRVNSDVKGPYLVSKDKLQNNSNSDYYINTSKLNKDEVFISDMGLNMESGEVEIPYKPIIRICVPIYSSNNIYKGVLVVNYLGQDMLDVLSEEYEDSVYTFIKPSLINNDGYYLFNSDDMQNFGFALKNEKNNVIYDFDKKLWENIKSKDSGYYEKGNEVYYYMNVKPLYNIDFTGENNYSWFIVSKFNLEDLPIVNEQVFLGMRDRDIFILIGVSILILIILSIIYYSQKDKEELNILQKMIENINDAVLITDNKTKITYVNQSFEKITGYTREDVLGLKTNYFKTGKQSAEFYKEMWNSINTKGYWSGELWDKKKDGVLYSKKLSIYTLKDKSNMNITKYMGIFSDLTDSLEKENYIEKLKNYNLKTNLPNENLTNLLINNIIKNQNINFSIIYFTIENYNSLLFKFNEDDTLFINPLIKNIKKLLKEEDFIAQIAKNNFIVGISSYNTKEDVRTFVDKLFNESNKLFRQKEEIIFLDMKAGISSYPEDGKDSNELVSNAYIALNKALNNNEAKYEYYTSELKANMENEIKMEMLLRRAVENDELSIHYQPQVDINKGVTVGAEALLRWNNKELGNVSPVVFIPLAEKTGVIIEIGYWIIENVFKDYLLMREKVSRDFRISINISPIQFRDEALIEKIKEFGEKYQVDFSNFEIEITESTFITDVNDINNKFDKFKELGLTIAVDDFGTGFSSLSYLRKLNIDKLKIDRSFIKDYPQNDNGEIAELITNISNKLNLKVITEGAETEEQINHLKSIGCNLVQGYYYSKPLPKEDFYKFLDK
ncbi:EAL domain-containing protein [Clostridium sp. C2-6-12]|uniref:bifunctional diguanylate cyclase/phosphodiesterase n=1 Tax=Clostridium sp. C2-6-12 TaxID=2698832 RepID=UPI001369282F|nr:EAL domain-containing protein [Clostridium sp. C2-6-12]